MSNHRFVKTSSLLLATVGTIAAVIIVGPSFAQNATKPPVRIGDVARPQIQKVGSPLTYTKRRMAVSVVDFDPFEKNLPTGGFMAGFQSSGFAAIGFTPDDVPRLPVDIDVSLTLYSMYSPEPYRPIEAGVTLRGAGQFYEYKSEVKPHLNGSGIAAVYNPGAQVVTLDLIRTFDQQFANLPWPQLGQYLKGPMAGVFVLHADFYDHSRKVWYYADATFRLYYSYMMNSGESWVSALQKLAGRMPGGS